MKLHLRTLFSIFFLGVLVCFSANAAEIKSCTSSDLSNAGISPGAVRGRVRRVVPVVRSGDLNPKPTVGYVVVTGVQCDLAYVSKANGAAFDNLSDFKIENGVPCSEHVVNLRSDELLLRAIKSFEGWEPKGNPILNREHYKKKWVQNSSAMVCDDLVDHESGACNSSCRALYDKSPQFYCEKTLPVILSVSPNSPCKACCATDKSALKSKTSAHKTEKKKKFQFKDIFDKSNSIAPNADSSPQPNKSSSASDLKKEEADVRPNSLRSMRKLNEALKKYTEHLKKSEFEMASKYVPDSLLKKWGGPAGYKKLMTDLSKESLGNQGVDLLQVKTHRPGRIEEGAYFWVSVVPSEYLINKPNVKGYLFASLVALSDNKGLDWKFVDAGKDYKTLMTEKDPRVLKLVKIPKRKMLTEKNAVKTYQVQTEGKWKVISEREFYRDLPQRKGIFFELKNLFKVKTHQ